MNADLSAQIRTYIGDSRRGLPEEVFRLLSELTPLVNVDLLIKDGTSRICGASFAALLGAQY